MFYILTGTDDYSLHQALEKIKGSITDTAMLSANTTVLEGAQVTAEELQVACHTVPFLSEKRLVIVNGLLARFEPKEKTGRKKSAKAASGPEHQSFAAALEHLPESTILVLVDGETKPGNPLLKELSGKAEVQNFVPLDKGKLRQWLHDRVNAEGGKIAPPALDLLVKIVGNDLWAAANEINKLVLFAAGRRIEEVDVKQMVSVAEEANIFALVDGVLEFNTVKAMESLQTLLQDGAASGYILTMLARSARLVVMAKELKEKGLRGSELYGRIDFKEWVARKAVEQGDRCSWERVKYIYNRLLDTDLAIKTGRCEEDLAMNILVAELCQANKAQAQ